MNDDEQVRVHHPLLQGVLAWCDQDIISKIIANEEWFSFIDLQSSPWPQIHPDRNRVPRKSGIRADYNHYSILRGKYWQVLEDDLVKRLTSEELYLEGVLVSPEMDQHAQAISGIFATEFHFILRENSLHFQDKKFVSVTLSKVPSTWAQLELGSPRDPGQFRPFNVGDLTADQIVELIEEHARRVVAEPNAKLMPPGKVSLIPLIRMKMRERMRRGELQTTLKQEAAWLEAWVSGKVEHWSTPKVATIKRSLGSTYEELKGGSNAGI